MSWDLKKNARENCHWSAEALKFDGMQLRYEKAPIDVKGFKNELEQACINGTKCSGVIDDEDYFDLTGLFKLHWDLWGNDPRAEPAVNLHRINPRAEPSEEKEERQDLLEDKPRADAAASFNQCVRVARP